MGGRTGGKSKGEEEGRVGEVRGKEGKGGKRGERKGKEGGKDRKGRGEEEEFRAFPSFKFATTPILFICLLQFIFTIQVLNLQNCSIL